MFLYPLAVGAVGIVGSLVAIPFVRISEPAAGEQPAVMTAMYRGLGIAVVVMLGLLLGVHSAIEIPYADALGNQITGGGLWLCALAGAIVTGIMLWITDVYTGDGSRFVDRIAQASEGGHGTNGH